LKVFETQCTCSNLNKSIESNLQVPLVQGCQENQEGRGYLPSQWRQSSQHQEVPLLQLLQGDQNLQCHLADQVILWVLLHLEYPESL